MRAAGEWEEGVFAESLGTPSASGQWRWRPQGGEVLPATYGLLELFMTCGRGDYTLKFCSF